MGWWLIVLGGLIAAWGLFFFFRIWWLGRKRHSFRTLLRRPGGTWKKGVACYGQRNMAWFGLADLSMRPAYMFPRAEVEVIGEVTHDLLEHTSLIHVRCGGETTELLLSTGDYTGIVSWIDSSPPRGTELY